MNQEGIDVLFLTLRQCPCSHIYSVLPFVPFDAQTMCEINSGILIDALAYVGLDIADAIRVAFHIQ